MVERLSFFKDIYTYAPSPTCGISFFFLGGGAVFHLKQLRVLRVSKLGGLLDRYTARYFYKGSKTSLHKHTGNLVENLFYKKCAFKSSLQLLTLKFLSQTTTTL
jgi:hypothetical protein